MTAPIREELIALLKDYQDIFAWSYQDMPGLSSDIVQHRLPLNPGSVTIPCSIGEVNVGKALIDLGASINLMPLSMCQRLGELEIMPTRMTL